MTKGREGGKKGKRGKRARSNFSLVHYIDQEENMTEEERIGVVEMKIKKQITILGELKYRHDE